MGQALPLVWTSGSPEYPHFDTLTIPPQPQAHHSALQLFGVHLPDNETEGTYWAGSFDDQRRACVEAVRLPVGRSLSGPDVIINQAEPAALVKPWLLRGGWRLTLAPVALLNEYRTMDTMSRQERRGRTTRNRSSADRFADVSDARRANMRAIGSRDTAPEMTVRRVLHSLGYRFRLQRRDLPGRPDIVLVGRRVIIDVRGCFWHRHSAPNCTRGLLPKSRRDWWLAKLERNVERDAANMAAWQATGWRVLVIWECEVNDSTFDLAERLRAFLGPARRRTPSRHG